MSLDSQKLFTLLAEGGIKPVIAAGFPLLEAAKADEVMESGQAAGNVVLLAPELLWKFRSLRLNPRIHMIDFIARFLYYGSRTTSLSKNHL